nr:hypothetical protein [candidate division KSB3 bacterium]
MTTMKIFSIGLICVFVVVSLAGCGVLSRDEDMAVQRTSAPRVQSMEGGTASEARVLDIATEAVPDKAGVTRVVVTLDKKTSYSTSREGSQLILTMFNATMASSLKQLEVKDPVVKSVVAKQVGNSVKGTIELVNQDIAYRPSTTTAPFQIVLDMWQLSPGTSLESQATTSAPVQGIDIQEVPASDSQRMQEVPVDARASSENITEPGASEEITPVPMTSPDLESQDIPTQLQWFSEKLSQVLQEREKIKQQLLNVEKDFAIKNSMIQVLERKLEEANTRILELEEEVIKAKSRVSLAEQNEEALRNELQLLVTQLEDTSGEPLSPVAGTSDKGELTDRSQQILSQISSLKQKSKAAEQVDSLKTQIDSLIEERDDLRTQNEAYLTEINSLKAELGKVAALQEQMRQKDLELDRLRNAIGAAAKLVMNSPGQGSVTTVTVPRPTASPPSALSSDDAPQISPDTAQAPPIGPSADQPEKPADTQLVLADLIQQQQAAMQSLNPGDYILGPDDVVQIKVLKEENLDKTVTVSPDGFITYPLLGDLRVDGLTTAQLDAQITSLLARDFLVDPEV